MGTRREGLGAHLGGKKVIEAVNTTIKRDLHRTRLLLEPFCVFGSDGPLTSAKCGYILPSWKGHFPVIAQRCATQRKRSPRSMIESLLPAISR